ncbi:MAG: hypothetical protein ACKOWK_03040 [Micrococcales bacterium]
MNISDAIDRFKSDLGFSFFVLIPDFDSERRFCLVEHQDVSLDYQVITYSVPEIAGWAEYYPNDVHIFGGESGEESVDDIAMDYSGRYIEEWQLGVWQSFFSYKSIPIAQELDENFSPLQPAYAGYQIADALRAITSPTFLAGEPVLDHAVDEDFDGDVNAACLFFANRASGLAFIPTGSEIIHFAEPALTVGWEQKARNIAPSQVIPTYSTQSDLEGFFEDFAQFCANPYSVYREDVGGFLLARAPGEGEPWSFSSKARLQAVCTELVRRKIAIALVPRVGQTLARLRPSTAS